MDRNQNVKRRRTSRRLGSRCADCANAIFDEQWGEFKCRARQIRISESATYADCKHYIKKNTKK